MINWEILGITPTTDKSIIKKAYRARLSETNPEDKPDEFMALRQAYEAALDYAAATQADPNPPSGAEGSAGTDDADSADGGSANGSESSQETPSALEADLLPAEHPAYDWTKRLQALYCDFYRRIDPARWDELVSDPLCTRIDTAADVQDALLRFLMECWFVPDSVIRALSKIFDFEANQEALMSRYPRDFVDAILLTPLQRQGGGLEYNLFEGAPDADYDAYINMYYALTGMVGRREQESAWKCVTDMEATGIFHPYIHVERAKLYLNEEKPQLAAAEMEAIYPAYDSSATICCMAGEVSLVEEDFQKAREQFTRAQEILQESRWSKIGLAEANLGLKDYEEAEKWVNQVLAEDRYSPRGQELERAIQEGQKTILLERTTSGQATDKERLDLGIIHIDSGEFQEACSLLASFEATEKKENAERLHYLATAELSMEALEDALHHFRAAAEILQGLLEVTADDEEKAGQAANLARTRVMESVCLEQLDQLEEALTVVTNVTIDCPHLAMPFCRRAELHYELKQYQEAVDAATRSIELDDTFHLSYRIRGNAFYEMGYYNDAYQDCNDCIARYGGDIEAFFCKINILIEVREFEMAFQEIDGLEEQVKGTQITFLRGKAQEASGDLEKARLTYRQVLDDVADESREVYPPAEVQSAAGTYYRLAQVCEELYRKERRRSFWQEYMDLLEEGVKKFPSDLDLMSDLAGELYGQSRHKEAQKLYERLAELQPAGFRYAQLAGNEIQMDHFDAALRHLQTAEEMDPELIYTQILYCAVYTCRENYPAALEYIDRAKQLSDEQERNWPRILQDKAMVYARMKDYDRAIECYRENYQLYQQQEDIASIMEMYRLSGRFQEALDEGKSYMADHEPADSLQVLDEMKLAATGLDDWELTEHYCAQDSRTYNQNYYAGRFLMYSDAYGKNTPQQALDHFIKSSEVNPSSINNLIELAKLYLKLKDKKRAFEYAGKVLDAIPDDFMDCGYQRSFYLARSAEALVILGKYKEAMERIQQAIDGRKCDFCKYSGCIDAYCALVYMCCIRGDEEGAAKYLEAGLEISPYDNDLKGYPKYFMKKRGLFK